MPFLYTDKFPAVKFQFIAHIDAKGQQGDGYLGYHAGIVIFDEGIVPANVNYRTEHKSLLCELV